MKPQTIGRVLGTGLRVAGRMAGQRIAAGAQAATAESPVQAGVRQVKTAAKSSRNVGRGLSGFFRPFTRVGGILWLEVTGFFFLLFAAVFATAAWRHHPAHIYGPYGKPFLASAALFLIFAYLGATSFLSARRK